MLSDKSPACTGVKVNTIAAVRRMRRMFYSHSKREWGRDRTRFTLPHHCLTFVCSLRGDCIRQDVTLERQANRLFYSRSKCASYRCTIVGRCTRLTTYGVRYKPIPHVSARCGRQGEFAYTYVRVMVIHCTRAKSERKKMIVACHKSFTPCTVVQYFFMFASKSRLYDLICSVLITLWLSVIRS